MSSSTSNSRTFSSKARNTVWIVLSLALLFGVAEMGARKYARRRQNDLSDPKDFTSIGTRADQLMSQKGLKVVFVGNSAVQEGVDIPLFEKTISGGRSPVHATMCAASDSQVKDWYWMLEHNYWQPERHPDLFVVLFFSDTLKDTSVSDKGRLSQFFTTPRDWPEVLRSDVTTLGERGEFLFSYVSMLYAERAVTEDKLLRAFAPGYENYALQLNDTEQKQLAEKGLSPEDVAEGPASPNPASNDTLKRLLAKAQQQHAQLCFIAYPRNGKQYSYQVSPEVIGLIRQAGMSYIDLRQMPELTSDKYRDSTHMNENGRPILTRRLAQVLNPAIP